MTDVTNGGAHEAMATLDGVAESLIVLRRDDAVRVFYNVCPHAGRRLDWAPGRFLIEQAIVWNLSDAAGVHLGQAATFHSWKFLPE